MPAHGKGQFPTVLLLSLDFSSANNRQPSEGTRRTMRLMKQVDLSERQIEYWWRRRRAQDKPTTLVKFCETSWRCIYYTYSFIFGSIVMWDKPWLWDIKQCWYGYPHQSVTNDIWWYYMISMAFYWSLTASQFYDVKRKDFWQMFAHHMITILLMALSWVCNLHRVGSLVLLVHDCADIFLESAKLTKYAQYQKVCDTIFAIFTVVWIVTRLMLYPRIIYSSSVEAPQILPMFPAYYIFNTLLILLLVLHICWTYLIVQIAVKAIKSGQMEGDVRSSSSEEISDSSENSRPVLTNGGTPKKQPSKNGTTATVAANSGTFKRDRIMEKQLLPLFCCKKESCCRIICEQRKALEKESKTVEV
uniref:AGAP001761-PA n=1 Tax=Anopheles merus TaxID=30066 RepID=H6WAQ4_ANOME|nr:AGAP001761-PA [Anopheles merus]